MYTLDCFCTALPSTRHRRRQSPHASHHPGVESRHAPVIKGQFMCNNMLLGRFDHFWGNALFAIGAIYVNHQTAAAPIGRACHASAQKLMSGRCLTPAVKLELPLCGIQ
jgi:hypothetical protein